MAKTKTLDVSIEDQLTKLQTKLESDKLTKPLRLTLLRKAVDLAEDVDVEIWAALANELEALENPVVIEPSQVSEVADETSAMEVIASETPKQPLEGAITIQEAKPVGQAKQLSVATAESNRIVRLQKEQALREATLDKLQKQGKVRTITASESKGGKAYIMNAGDLPKHLNLSEGKVYSKHLKVLDKVRGMDVWANEDRIIVEYMTYEIYLGSDYTYGDKIELTTDMKVSTYITVYHHLLTNDDEPSFGKGKHHSLNNVFGNHYMTMLKEFDSDNWLSDPSYWTE